ncbi:LysR family transcriptional regulator [Nocardioides pacificus]
METESLRWFQQVVDGVTVTEVAQIFGVSQPAVSRALSRLESDVGAPLLHRTGRVLRPTHAGITFKRHADAVLHRLDDGLAAVAELMDPETGTVSIAFQLSLGTWLIPTLVSEFRQAHPGVQFRLRASDDAVGSSLVAEGLVDLEFTARRPKNPEVHWDHLVSQPLALAVPTSHPLARRSEVGLAEVADEEFVMLRSSWELRSLTERLCAAAGFTPRVSFEGDDLAVVRGFVEAGLGVAVVPVPLRRTAPAGGAETLVRITDAGAHREVGAAWSRSRRLLPAADLFRQHVRARRSGL